MASGKLYSATGDVLLVVSDLQEGTEPTGQGNTAAPAETAATPNNTKTGIIT